MIDKSRSQADTLEKFRKDFEEWYSKTQDHGGSLEEWFKLKGFDLGEIAVFCHWQISEIERLQEQCKELLEAKHDADSRHKQEFKRREELEQTLEYARPFVSAYGRPDEEEMIINALHPPVDSSPSKDE